MMIKGKSSTYIPPLLNPTDDSFTDNNIIKCDIPNEYFVTISNLGDSSKTLFNCDIQTNSMMKSNLQK